jgi:hypothetical protein
MSFTAAGLFGIFTRFPEDALRHHPNSATKLIVFIETTKPNKRTKPDSIHIGPGSFLIGICNIVSIETTCTLKI